MRKRPDEKIAQVIKSTVEVASLPSVTRKVLEILKTDAQGGVQVRSVTVSSGIELAGVILFGGSVGVAEVGASLLR